MDSSKQERPSFARGKINDQHKGPSGVTATNANSSKPFHEPNSSMTDGLVSYESSALLYLNIDKLAETLQNMNPSSDSSETQSHETDLSDEFYEESEPDITGLSEDEIIADLDRHLGIIKKTIIDPRPESSEITEITENAERDLFCRSCGTQYYWSDNYCARCGKKRGK